MKRTIAITLTALLLALTLIGCGSKNDGNVSDTNNGTVNSSSGRYRNGLDDTHTSQNDVNDGRNYSNENKDTKQDSGFMNDMKDAASDIGDAVDNAGSAVNDVITGNSGTPSTGMTGGR